MATTTNASSTGIDTQADLRKRNVAAPNGTYVPKEVAAKLDEKSKQKVRTPEQSTGRSVRDG